MEIDNYISELSSLRFLQGQGPQLSLLTPKKHEYEFVIFPINGAVDQVNSPYLSIFCESIS